MMKNVPPDTTPKDDKMNSLSGFTTPGRKIKNEEIVVMNVPATTTPDEVVMKNYVMVKSFPPYTTPRGSIGTTMKSVPPSTTPGVEMINDVPHVTTPYMSEIEMRGLRPAITPNDDMMRAGPPPTTPNEVNYNKKANSVSTTRQIPRPDIRLYFQCMSKEKPSPSQKIYTEPEYPLKKSTKIRRKGGDKKVPVIQNLEPQEPKITGQRNRKNVVKKKLKISDYFEASGSENCFVDLRSGGGKGGGYTEA